MADADAYYKPYQQRKIRRDGTVKVRQIEPSDGYLKKVQKKIDKVILKPAMATLPDEIMGGRRGISVVRNATVHANSPALMKYDIKNFFPSITYGHIYHIFRYRLNFCEEAANVLTKLTTYPSSKAHVPQGAPTSTSLAMFAIEQMTLKLKTLVDAQDLRLSIWVDDITISGTVDSLGRNRTSIGRILNAAPYSIHPDKDTGIIKKGGRVKNERGRRVTGVVIDNTNRLTLGRRKLKGLKRRVARIKKESPSLRGSLAFLRHVSPSQGKRLYHEYKKRVGGQP
ncbi:MAG TPA: reverse transcriptase family protein [Candidatus Saccharimonadales bacterium]|nr:reverse transcriptase family protein [Candidatus Saccharimonadales bacterium]